MANKIQMIELSKEHNAIREEIETAINKVIDSSAFIHGEEIELFERNLARYLNVKHVIGCANGTDALQIALMALDLKPGDEVLVPAFTYVATAEVIALLKLIPVMYDVNPRTFNTDGVVSLENAEELINDKTKAIVPVHLFGQCSDMNAVLAVAKRYNLKVVEDCAQALGAKCKVGEEEKFAGTIGNIGCTSFFPTKNLGAMGDGGALFTNDDALAARIRMIASHGQEKKYHHKVIGVNSRLDTIQAAVLNVKLKYLDSCLTKRRQAAALYTTLFTKADPQNKYLYTPQEAEYSTHTYHQYTLIIKDKRDALKQHLADKGIASMIYYPLPLSDQEAFKNIALRREDFSDAATNSLHNSEYLAAHVLSLPMNPTITKEDIELIVNEVINFLKGA